MSFNNYGEQGSSSRRYSNEGSSGRGGRGGGGHIDSRRFSGGGRYDNNRGGGSRDRRGGPFPRSGSGNRGPGTGRAPGDDSITNPLPAQESPLIPSHHLKSISTLPAKAEATVRANGHEIDATNALVAYQYDIKWTGNKKGRIFDLNQQTKSDHKLQLKQNALNTVFYLLIHQYKDFFKTHDGNQQYSYDSGRMFFCQTILLSGDETSRSFNIDMAEFDQNAKDYYGNFDSISAEVTMTREISPKLLNGDLDNDRPAIQYLEVVFSQAQRNRKKYLNFSNKFYDNQSNDPIEETPFTMKEGVIRSIRAIGDPADHRLMLQMNPTKGTFYGQRTIEQLLEYVLGRRLRDIDVMNRKELKAASDAIKNITVRTTHLEKNKFFVTAGLSKNSAKRLNFICNEEEISVAQYYERRYKINLRYPNLPCVIEKRKNRTDYFPLEILEIPESQRIPKAKQSNHLNARIIRKCQLLPSENLERIEKERDAAEIFNSNDYIKNTGVRVNARQLVTAPSSKFEPPSIVLHKTQKTLKGGAFGMVQNEKFVLAAKIQKLAVVLALPDRDRDLAGIFYQDFLHHISLYGVVIELYEVKHWNNPDRDFNQLEDYARQNFTFALIFGDRDDLHHGMKESELSTRLVTQHIHSKTVRKYRRGNNSLLDNVAFKFNLKAGGLNWSIASGPQVLQQLRNYDLLKTLMQNTLFFGVHLSHPTSSPAPNTPVENVVPTCVGFCSNIFNGQANMNKGDFGYQYSKKSFVDAELMESKFTAALQAYYRNSGRYPSWIVVYRAGLSEGELNPAIEAEVMVLKRTIQKLEDSNDEFKRIGTKLTVIAANQKSSLRIFKEKIEGRNSIEQNVPPGTCVSQAIVPRHVPSFLLVSQRSLIGTAHAIIYHILEGDEVVPTDHIRWLTYCLAYTHGIVTSPTALPGPLKSAEDLSKRAKNNFAFRKKLRGDDNYDASPETPPPQNLTEEEKERIKLRENEHFRRLNEALRAAIQEGRFWA